MKKKKLKTNQSTFIRHRKIAFHARVFGGFLRTGIILNHIPKSHHFIYIEISHRFHLCAQKDIKMRRQNGKDHK